jgi:hypothetical protein
MFEYDENGKEWFGYTFSSEESDHAAVVSVFLGNVQYLECSTSITVTPSHLTAHKG